MRGIGVLLVAEGDRFQRKERFAGFAHGFDLLFIALRGNERSERAIRVNVNRPVIHKSVVDAADIGECVRGTAGRNSADGNHIGLAGHTGIADIDIVAARSLIDTGSEPDSGVAAAGGVSIERRITVGRVVAAGCVVRERISASGTVKKPAGVAKERKNARGGVETAIGIVKQGPKPVAVFWLPAVRWLSAWKPVPVFQIPVVRLTSTPMPSPLLEPGMEPSVSGPIACAIGEAKTGQCHSQRHEKRWSRGFKLNWYFHMICPLLSRGCCF